MLTFWEWHHYADKKPAPIVPQADRAMHLIQQSGRRGISRGELGAAIDLERHSLDDLLQALAASGQVLVSLEGQRRVYRAR